MVLTVNFYDETAIVDREVDDIVPNRHLLSHMDAVPTSELL